MLLFQSIAFFAIFTVHRRKFYASAFDKQLNTLSAVFVAKRELLPKILCLFVACVCVVKIKYVLQPHVSCNLNKYLRLACR